MKYLRFLRKRMNTKPSHGPIHFRAPSKILWRTIRGMIPHKTKRGEAALARLKVYEGVPPPYDKIKRMVIPDALKVLRLQAGHKYCVLGRLSSEVGWNHYDTIRELEKKRKDRAQVTYEKRKQLTKLRVRAGKIAEDKLGSQLDIIAPINNRTGIVAAAARRPAHRRPARIAQRAEYERAGCPVQSGSGVRAMPSRWHRARGFSTLISACALGSACSKEHPDAQV
ncbi:Ribosomal protein L13 family protein [Perilla frutescens var. hirtella]|uniref:Ribosomal protein L13 family protein n=1 Tax=Perilla frutescens var. hirtella TaxID=608512 RepID=A0AAD4PC06_PERFH|nr:Ribosomal protein L13 family protein [Perilla frutescens var. hirtella]